jgi:hypothetical protein
MSWSAVSSGSIRLAGWELETRQESRGGCYQDSTPGPCVFALAGNPIPTVGGLVAALEEFLAPELILYSDSVPFVNCFLLLSLIILVT